MSDQATLLRDGLTLIATVGGPLFATLFAVGLALGVMQAATQINDPAVSFLPRLSAALLVCVLLGGWMVERLADFVRASLEAMAQRGG